MPIEVLEKALKEREEEDCFLECVNDLFEKIPMISNDRIRYQFKLLGIEYKKVAYNAFQQEDSIEKAVKDLNNRLEKLFKRRNEIAHQTDRTHFNARLQRISEGDVTEFVEDAKKIVKAIDAEARKKYNQSA